MRSQNRVQAIKSRFENLNEGSRIGIPRPVNLNRSSARNVERTISNNDEAAKSRERLVSSESDDDSVLPEPNDSYLYSKAEANRTLTRQASDPGKKLHRSHAFRCERREKISPKRHSSCNGRSVMNEATTLKIGEKPRLSRDRLKRLGLLLDDRMRRENYVPLASVDDEAVSSQQENMFCIVPKSVDLFPKKVSKSVPDEEVPKHILDQYAKVLKPKKKTDLPAEIIKSDIMTDSGVSSETENSQENDACEKTGRLNKLRAHFEGANKTEQKPTQTENKENEKSDLEIYASTETIRRIERKNPHVILTDTLKKALKQPLPRGPPPKKPPRTFLNVSGESAPNSPEFSPIPERKNETVQEKKSTKQILEKLEKALQKHNESKVIIPRQNHNIYDIAESEPEPITAVKSKRKETHYLCTEILDIAKRPLLVHDDDPITNCFNSLNCAIVPNRSSSSIPYAKLSTNSPPSSLSNICCACNDSVESNNDIMESRSKFSTFFLNKSEDLCKRCGINFEKGESSFRCHLGCKCNTRQSNDEHIYAEPYHHSTEGLGKKSINCDVTPGVGAGLVREVNHAEISENVSSERAYGVVNSTRKSLEELQHLEKEEEKIYDIPCDPSRSPSPDVPRNFDSLLRTFENPEGRPKPVKSRSLDIPDLLKHEKLDPTAPKIGSFDLGVSSNGILDIGLPNLNISELRNPKTGSLDVRDSTNVIPELKTSTNGISVRKTPKNGISELKIPKNFISSEHKTLKNGFRARLTPSKSSENLSKDFGLVKKSLEKKFATDGRRQRRFERNATEVSSGGQSVQKKCLDRKNQLDVDRENLNKLMSEIYETVSAHCDMETVSKFPVDSECSGSEDSVKLSRSMTEKRKTYVRRVSSRAAYLDPQARNVRARHQTLTCAFNHENTPTYNTFRSWKSFKKHRNSSLSGSKLNLNDQKIFNKSDVVVNTELDTTDRVDSILDNTAGCLDIDTVLARERSLFDVSLLVGLNHMTGQAYVKSVFPKDVTVPPHIENLVFPETLSSEQAPSGRPDYDLDASSTQCYSLVLTNERGERSFGYCRRVLPEGATFCLPLAYCIISRFRAPGFYYKVLKELESHHGTSDQALDSFLQQLFEKDFPSPGESITLTKIRTPKKSIDSLHKDSIHRNSVNLGDMLKSKTLQPSPKRSDHDMEKLRRTEIPQYYDLENNNNRPRMTLPEESLTLIKVIKRPIEPRLDEDNLSTLVDSINVGLLIKIFGTMLLERKVVLVSDKLSQLSSCIEALQGIMYPLVWQQPLVSTIPAELRRDILEAPLPILAGMLSGQQWQSRLRDVQLEEGILIDLSKPGGEVIIDQGDEATIIPSSCYKTLKTALQLESTKNLQGTDKEGEKARNVLIAEAFLRFFVEMFADLWSCFRYGKRKREEWEDAPVTDQDVVIFEKEQFIRSAPSKQVQYFLEWFTETAMFNHFIQNMSQCYPVHRNNEPLDFTNISGLVDTPYPNYYEVFDERWRHLLSNSGKKPQRCVKTVLNKKVKLLRNKLRELVN